MVDFRSRFRVLYTLTLAHAIIVHGFAHSHLGDVSFTGARLYLLVRVYCTLLACFGICFGWQKHQFELVAIAFRARPCVLVAFLFIPCTGFVYSLYL